MNRCGFPEHHATGKSGSVGLVAGLVVAVIAAAVVWKARHVIIAVAVWSAAAAGLAAAAAVVVLAIVVVTGRRVPWLRHVLLATWVLVTWRSVCRRLGLISRDRQVRPGSGQRPRRAHHPLAVAWPTRRGVVVSARTVAGVSRVEVEQQAEHFRNHWRCSRVQVIEYRPGEIRIYGYRRDPLAEPLEVAELPAFDGRRVWLGRDEFGQMRAADLANLSGSAFSGSPGRGKTEAALSLAAQLVPSPLVDTWILDGGACDWSGFAGAAAGYVADDLAAAADMLAELDARMCLRRRDLRSDRGARNGWSAGGPVPGYRLQWVLADEAPFYLDLDAVKGDRAREDLVRRCRGLLAGLLRRGRAPLFHTTLIAQKGTGTSGLPPDLRDLCGLRWSFGVATMDAAAAILGEQIRQYADTMSPTLLQDPDRVGVATVLMRTHLNPFTLVRFPAVGEDLADQIALEAAGRRAAELAVPDTPAELVS